MTLSPLPVPHSENGKVGFITDTLVRCCIGKESPHTWKVLFRYFKRRYPGLDEKEMRDICHDNLLIGWSSKGIYIVNSIEEIEQVIKSRSKTIQSHRAYIQKLDDYRQFLLRKREEEERRRREGQSPQMRLF